MSSKKKHPAVISIIAAAFILSGITKAQEDGKQWIERVAAAYKELATYRFEGTIVSEKSGFTKSSKTTTFARCADLRSGMFKRQAGMADSRCVVFSDGKSTCVYFGGSRKYATRKTADTNAVIREIFKGDASQYLGGSQPESYELLKRQVNKAVVLRKEPVALESGSVNCVVVEATLGQESGYPKKLITRTLWIDPEKMIVLRDVERIKAQSFKGNTFYESLDDVKISNYSVNENMPDSTYHYELPRTASSDDSMMIPDLGDGLRSDPPIHDLSFADANGRSFNLKSYKGQYMLFDFWATWCVPCAKQMQLFEKEYQKLQNKGFIIFGANSEPEETQKGFLKKKKFSYPMLLDLGKTLEKRFHAKELPTTVIVDGDGNIIEWELGVYKQEEFDKLLASLGIN